MKTSEVLRAARKVIERPESWWRGLSSKDGQGDHCMVTALTTVIGRSPCGQREINFLRRACGDGVVLVSSWNDDPRRTHAEVLSAYDRAIALAETHEANQGPGRKQEGGGDDG